MGEKRSHVKTQPLICWSLNTTYAFYIEQLLGKREEKSSKLRSQPGIPLSALTSRLQRVPSHFNACSFSASGGFIPGHSDHTVQVGKSGASSSSYCPSPHHRQPQPILWADGEGTLLESVRLSGG